MTSAAEVADSMGFEISRSLDKIQSFSGGTLATVSVDYRAREQGEIGFPG